MYEKIWPVWSDGVEASLRGGNDDDDDDDDYDDRMMRRQSKRQQRQRARNKKRGQGQLASVYRQGGGGPEYLEIAHPPVVRHVGRDCYCEFWDSLEYRY